MGTAHGSQNSDLFRQQMIRNQLPNESSINTEGLLNEYYFETSKQTDQLVHGNFSCSQMLNIYTNKQETYLSIGLHSSKDGKNQREPLNLVIVLDVSGSMGEYFHRKSPLSESQTATNSRDENKIDIAKQILHELVEHMDSEHERLGVVLFNHNATLLQPIRLIKNIDREILNDRIDHIRADGSTNMESGMTMAISMLTDMLDEDNESRTNNNRILFLTDALPNVGGSEKCLLDLAKRAVERSSIYITYIGVGLDFNSDLVYELTKIRASNYFSVHSKESFRRILLTDFNYIVTPIAFNVRIFVESNKYEIDKVYGIPEGENTVISNHIITIDSYSASAMDKLNRIKGSLFLVKLKETVSVHDHSSDNQIRLTIKYEKANDGQQQSLPSEMISINGFNMNESIRKAILLVQYAILIQAILRDVSEHTRTCDNEVKLRISRTMKNDLLKFRTHFVEEMKVLDDEQLTRELDILDQFRYAEEI
ncbi:hypothetical protein I4U23_024098 [Adineta vaga]|nr:hypothetical protein I4U23_024098 [Adineta vaga]